MYINEQYGELDLIHYEKAWETARDGSICTLEEPILVEHLIDIYINETLTMKVTCTPQYLTELILGRLLTEGMIHLSLIHISCKLPYILPVKPKRMARHLASKPEEYNQV